jgi:hypothetical protein
MRATRCPARATSTSSASPDSTAATSRDRFVFASCMFTRRSQGQLGSYFVLKKQADADADSSIGAVICAGVEHTGTRGRVAAMLGSGVAQGAVELRRSPGQQGRRRARGGKVVRISP